MDDEEFIREVSAALLEKMGYEVMLAEDGDAAVALYRNALKTDTSFDAVILDLTVPGAMGGLETVRQLKALDPNVRAIVSSGYSNDSVMANFANFGFRAAVKKPYQMREMSLVLNEVLKG
jgi:two-component system cell cycle sensor histidine kinase/response regulator CckA